MSDLKDAVRIIREDSCPCCKYPRSIDCFNNKGQPMRYSLILDERDKGKIDTFPDCNGYIMFMQCSRCKTRFILDWYGREFPRPLVYPKFYFEFIDNYGGH